MLIVRSLVTLSVAAGIAAAAQVSGAQEADHGGASRLQPLEFLVGACWTGTFENGARDTHCFESMYGHFVRDRHEVLGVGDPYRGETLYRWDAEARTIRFIYFNSLGGVSEGTAQQDGDALVFPERHRGKDGTVQEMRNIWRRRGSDEYVALTERRTTGGWEEIFRIAYRRQN